MKNKNLAIILIIAHKTSLSDNEEASLKQCYKILNKYPIKLICPEGLNISCYKQIIPDIQIDFINPKWQSTYSMFNRLKISPLLYKKYKKYRFILYYELDAWVFKDELEYWCNQNYDFIGAPWYHGYKENDFDAAFIGVGNGGFSLRKVDSHLRVLHSFSYIESAKKLLKDYVKRGIFRRRNIIDTIKNLTIRNNTFYLFNNYYYNEDKFWGLMASKKFSWYKVPSEKIASQFSVELKAPKLIAESNGKLPFGCHAWPKYYQEFWKDYISG